MEHRWSLRGRRCINNALVSAVVFVLLLVLGVGCAHGSAHQSKSVNVAVRAKWAGTPLLLEASELLGKEGDHYFWRFVEDWLNIDKPADPSDKDCVQLIVKQGSALLGKTLSPLFHFSLLLRSVSPKVVLYRQLAQESLSTHFSSDPLRSTSDEISSTSRGRDNSGTETDAWSSSENPSGPQGKCCWVDVGSQAFLEDSDLKEWLQSTKHRSHGERDDSEIYEFDHVYPESEAGDFVAILYGSLGTPCFRSFHALLREGAKQGHVKYVFRPVLPSGCVSLAEGCSEVGARGPVNLGGYGVELALKNMEYKAIDDSEVKKGDGSEDGRVEDDLSQDVKGFIFSKLLERKPELAGELLTFRDHLLSSGADDTLNVWELKDLGYQTAQRIVLASEPLRLMQDINQNFPNLVSSLSRMQLNETIKEEIVVNQRMVPPGRNLFAINGALVNPDTLDLFSLLEIVEGELSVAGKLADVKVPPKYIKELLQLTEAAESTTFRVDFRSEHVHYLNNLEQDPGYRRWRTDLQQLLMPAYPGQMRYIRKNLYHTIYIIDPASPSGLKTVERMSHYFQNNVPMRFGVGFLSSQILNKIETHGGDFPSTKESDEEEDVSELAIRLVFYLKENFDMTVAVGFLNLVHEAWDGSGDDENEPISASYYEDVFVDILRARGKSGPSILHELKEGDDFRDAVFESTKFVYKLGLSQMNPCMLMNGLVYGPSQVQNAAITAMNEEQTRLQEAVYYGRVNGRTDILDHFWSDGGQARYNPQIVGTKKEERKFVTLSRAVTEKGEVLTRLQYLHHPGSEDEVKPITHWLCVDLSKKNAVLLLQQAIRYLMEGSKMGRIGVLHNMKDPGTAASPTYSVLVRIVLAAANSPSRRAKVVPFLQRVLALEQLEESNIQHVLDLAKEMGLNKSYLEKALSDPEHQKVLHDQLYEDRLFVSRVIGLKPGAAAVITNGRVYMQQKKRYFVAEDFTLLDSVEYQNRVKPVADVIDGIEWNDMEADDLTSDFISTIIMAVSSSMAARSRSSDTARFDMLKAEHSAIIRDSEDANLHVDAVVDPLSATGQKITPLLVLLQEWLPLSVRIVLNPMNSLADLPLKNFYRYVVPSKNDFTTDGALVSGPVGTFSNMPPSRTLTLNLDVPEPWLVEPVIAIHDLDNIVLENLKDERTMSAVYELEALVVTGHCYEKSGEPPRGLQLLLGTKLHPHMVDTIVMANLGYWQLKAAPGVWALSLAPGRSSEIYTLEGPGEGTDHGPLSMQVVVQDLKGKLVRFEVVKRRGQEDQVMLDPNADEESDKDKRKRNGKGFLKWASDFLGSGNKHGEQGNELRLGGANKNLVRRRGETINIFSIASGHLYERFLKIMMLSVLKNTNRPVKFWFIKNYLSPQFKDVIPHMATEYGFEYGLVTYKWPSWLHKQTEKQRIIWAYKILFLDVIFPLSLKKVIFVDADQIVRTDMGELYDMDIKGRPLAYTPFCENNKEMDGFRFWNQGFWKDHLRGKPYHISALYVVDLVKFRQSAAGDNLRVFYETLSKDPNSLSNLDQDLPNYAQHNVPIFSLPQEWLWCESWCGNSTKSRAKTIDLCNNPMTKEPKLQGARRIVAEWPALDEEARQFTAKILGRSSEFDVKSTPVEITPPETADPEPKGQESTRGMIFDRMDRELSSKDEL
ncbi:unnamed protein product [Calypogeia fissa]